LKRERKKAVRTLTFEATRIHDLVVIPAHDFRRITRALDKRGVVLIRAEAKRG
jgi:hypothetical protein